MKTKNNVQQAILKSLAVVFSLILISITVNAQDLLRSIYENNAFKDIALAMADVNSETATELNNANTFSAFAEVESEAALNVEDWMIDETNFAIVISFQEEIESPLDIESWMTDDNYFNHPTFQYVVETENELEIEDWMLSNNLFTATSDNEKPLELENWMISDKVWNN